MIQGQILLQSGRLALTYYQHIDEDQNREDIGGGVNQSWLGDRSLERVGRRDDSCFAPANLILRNTVGTPSANLLWLVRQLGARMALFLTDMTASSSESIALKHVCLLMFRIFLYCSVWT